MTAVLERVGVRRPNQLPPVLDVAEVTAVLAGELLAPTPAQLRSQLAIGHASLPSAGHRQADGMFGPQHCASDLLPDARTFTQRFALALVECLDGRRPPTQLSRHVDADVLARIGRRHRATLRRGCRPGLTQVRRVRVCEPRDGVLEAAVVARIGGRATPIALRAVGMDGRWVVTILEVL